jgi:MoaA/NifB/PqqE/SkfB family radical SAM enzyme
VAHRAVTHTIDDLRAPLLVTWQLTRDCDLCCLHCCTDSAPGKRLHDELDADEAMRLARGLVDAGVPYVMLCGGEPLIVPHFMAVAEALGHAGVQLKIETNGQRLDDAIVARLARLPIRSIQISLDGDTQATYERQRPGASLAKAHAACQAVRDAGLPLEITFAPSRLNLDEAGAVIERARSLDAFRFNTGKLMRVGTAARTWTRIAPTEDQYQAFRALLSRQARVTGSAMQLCHDPYSIEDGLRAALEQPPATLLVLPNGWVKVAAALPGICADLRRTSLADAWQAYREAWQRASVRDAVLAAIEDESLHGQANAWHALQLVNA